jgi:amidohydrolase
MQPTRHAACRLAGIVILTTVASGTASRAEPPSPPAAAEVDRLAAAVMPKVVSWRRDIHQHPELGNRETRTAALVADHLRALGLEVRTGVARTGVVGVLRGGRPGPVVALRADMDALPVTEQVDLPFASRVRTTWNGQEVGVMHACGHDNHVAILMGAAEVLAGMRASVPGTVVFLFQPAEEGAPRGEEGGAEVMIREGALDDPRVEAIFGLHVFTGPLGSIGYRAGGFMASGDTFRITVKGRQTHGAQPWRGVDPIVVGSQIVIGLQTIVSRQIELTATPAVISAGIFRSGVRSNIIPDEAYLEGTIRVFDETIRADIHRRVRATAESIAVAGGATAEVEIEPGNPVTFNDPDLTRRMLPTLERVAPGKVMERPPQTVAEDFSLFQKRIPGLFVFLGVTPEDQDWRTAASNHSPMFFADEAGLPVGVRLLANLALDYLAAPSR